MASPSFLLPFAHWDALTSFVPPSSTVTVAKFLPQWLFLGLSCGELLLLSTSANSDGVTVSPHARLSGHKAAVIALQTVLARTEGGKELLLLSLDSVGRLCKWSLSDGRCLQSVSSTISSRPIGFKVIEKGTHPKDVIQDSVILVYGCSTEIVVLNAETLGTMLLWTGNVDWPIPAIADGGREVLTLISKCKIQGWALEKRASEIKGTGATVSLEKDYNRQYTIQAKTSCGAILGFERCSGYDYVLVQRRGVRVYAAENKSFVLRKTFDVAPGGVDIAGYEVFEKRGLVFVWDFDGGVRVIGRGESGLWGVASDLAPPESVKEGERAVVMAFTERKGIWVAAAFFQSKSVNRMRRPGGLAPQGDLVIGVFSLKDDGRDITWNDNKEGVRSPIYFVIITRFTTVLHEPLD